MVNKSRLDINSACFYFITKQMNRFTFIFLTCIYALFLVYQAFIEIPLEHQLIAASLFILLFGIPHGAIDHVLFFRKRKMTTLKFYTLYLGLIVCFVGLWFWQPLLSFVLFLLLSAYHFGESQLVDIKQSRLRNKPLIYFNWGMALLATLMYYNISELKEITTIFQDTVSFNSIYNERLMFWFFLFTNILNIATLSFLFYTNKLTSRRFSSELFLIALIHLTFFLFPFIIGFSLYFVVLHSIVVMHQEYMFFKSENESFTVFEFIKLLLPYSVLSIVFTVLLLSLSYWGIINISVPFLAIIIISVITLPHAIVMTIFYSK